MCFSSNVSFHGGCGFRMLQHAAGTIESEHGTKPSSVFLFLYTSSLFLCRRSKDCVMLFFFSSRFRILASQISPCSVHLSYVSIDTSEISATNIVNIQLAQNVTDEWLAFVIFIRVFRVRISILRPAIVADDGGSTSVNF
jgi:hypothetical protein